MAVAVLCVGTAPRRSYVRFVNDAASWLSGDTNGFIFLSLLSVSTAVHVVVHSKL